MKKLSDYTNTKISALFEEMGAFFAYSELQYEEEKKEGIEYVALGGGLIVPKENAEKLMKGLDDIQEAGIKQDLEENGKEAIIKRELESKEVFEDGSIDEAVSSLKRYGISKEEVQTAFETLSEKK